MIMMQNSNPVEATSIRNPHEATSIRSRDEATPKKFPFWEPVLFAFLFAISYTQPLAFYSNQNQYFLHPLADAGFGYLQHDWLAQTIDPTPLFSWLMRWVWVLSGMGGQQVIFFLTQMVYFLALWSILHSIGFLPKSSTGRGLWAGLLTVSHAGIFRYLSDRFLGADYFWFFQSGLANQYLLGAGLQPSVSGVVILVAIALFTQGRPVAACAVAAATNYLHATYLLPTAWVVWGIMVQQALSGNRQRAMWCGGMALAIALPVVIFNAIRFGPTDAETFTRAQQIMAHIRIPHHTRPERWFDVIAALQCVGMGAAWLFVRRTILVGPIFWMLLLIGLGIVASILTNHLTLQLLFPWRISAVLVPLSTAILLSRVVIFLERWPYLCGGIGGVLLASSVIGAAVIYQNRLGYREPESEDSVLEYVRQTHQAGELYLIPARFPKPTQVRGVFSNTFAPPPKSDAIVYFELARFRLTTGAAVFIDFKSMPYKDTDIIEWHRRVSLCEKWYAQKVWGKEIIEELRQEGITHVLVPRTISIESPWLELKTDTGTYAVYALRSS
jgi:uncharacterized membrane protein YwaF